MFAIMSRKYEPVIRAALEGGRLLKKYFGRTLAIEEKSLSSDLKTVADKESEDAILRILSENYPKSNILAEESGFQNNDSEHIFVVDPLDGTNNFILTIPYFSSTIALIERNDVVFAVTYNPVLNQIFWAEKDRGAFLGEKRLKVNGENNISKTSVAYTCGYEYKRRKLSTIIFRHLTEECNIKRFLTNWCPTLDYCLLASGKIEAVINNDNEIYDYIAGKLIVREAGGKITDFRGNEEITVKNSIFLATNGTSIHDQLLEPISKLK